MSKTKLTYRRPQTPFTHLTLGQRVQWLLIRRKLSQTAAAQLAGVSQATIANIINGNRNPNAETMMKLVRSLDTSPDFIMYGTGLALSNAEAENDTQAELLQIYKALDATQQGMLMTFARVLSGKPTASNPKRKKPRHPISLLLEQRDT